MATESKPENKKIDMIMASAMVVVALCFDLLSIIPIVSILTAFTFWMIMTTWLYFLGFSPFQIRRVVVAMVGFLLELIPVISILPCLTISLVVMIIMINSDTLQKIKKIV